MSWTDDIENDLAVHYGQGLSRSRIMTALNEKFGTDFTRSAVIGKIDRLKKAGRLRDLDVPSKPKALTGRSRPPRRRASVPALRLAPAPRPARVSRKPPPQTEAVNAKAVGGGQGVSLLDIESGQCRFPVKGRGVDVRFCGRPVDPDAPRHGRQYCADHRAIATAAPRTRGEINAVRLPTRGRARALTSSERSYRE